MSAQLTPKTIITAHINADFDALAAMVAAKRLYPEGVLVAPPRKEKIGVNYFLDSISYIFSFVPPKNCDFSQVETLVAVDTRQRRRLAHVAEVLDKPGLIIHAYDHHPDSEDDLPASLSVVKPWGSTTSVIAHLLMEKKIALSPDEATMLGLGLYEDTGSFTFESTTEFDFATGGWLRTQMMDLSIIADLVKGSLTSQQVLILNNMIENAVTHEVHGLTILYTEVSLEGYVEDFSVLAHQMLDMENSKVILALANMGDRVQLVARSRVPEIVDVGKLCAAFGGGGHSYAAAASIKDKTLSEIKAEIFARLYSEINSEITVGSKMTSPAQVVEDTEPLSKAEALMLRYGLKAAPVVAEGTMRCVGYLEYQTAARAVSHKLGSQPVSEYMHGRARTVRPESSLYPALDIILGQRQRLVPVVDEKENVVGVLTRTDVVRILVNESAHIPEGNPMLPSQKDKNISNVLKAVLPPWHFKILEKIGALADRHKLAVYAVGGFVRDLLLSQVNLDIDLTVEGDGINFARVLAEAFNGRVRAHPKFQTAIVIFKDEKGQEQRIDVATARLEYYEYPGALPTVELSSIKMDLYRRDFTINALAVQLNKESFGNLVDPYSGQRDMKDKNVRVLHSLSFVEDPTRVLRAIRFEKRFGFRIGPQTEKLIKNALQLGMLSKISGSRLLNELKHIFDEKSPLPCIQRMDSLGIWALIHPSLKLTPAKETLLADTEEVLSWYKLLYLKNKPQIWIVYLLGLCPTLKYKEMSEVLDRFAPSERLRADFLSLREATRVASRKLGDWEKRGGGNGELYKILSAVPLEGILHLMALNNKQSVKKPLSHFLSRLWNLRLDITGEDIKNLGAEQSPVVGYILRLVLEAKADERVQSKEEQLALAAELLAKYQAGMHLGWGERHLFPDEKAQDAFGDVEEGLPKQILEDK